MNRMRIMARVSAVLIMMLLLATPVLGIDEGEVQNAIAASSREQVAGNIFIWFLCAIGFLKISQKIDSFMASLGVNVGRTGSSLLTELLLAGRGITTMSAIFGKNSMLQKNSVSANSSTAMNTMNRAVGAGMNGGHGVIGLAHRAVGRAAAAGATGTGKGVHGRIGEALFNSSMSKGGNLASRVISSVALGSIATQGSIKGAQASAALSNYLGYNQTPSDQTPGSSSNPENPVHQEGHNDVPSPHNVPPVAPSPSSGGNAAPSGQTIITPAGGKAVLSKPGNTRDASDAQADAPVPFGNQSMDDDRSPEQKSVVTESGAFIPYAAGRRTPDETTDPDRVDTNPVSETAVSGSSGRMSVAGGAASSMTAWGVRAAKSYPSGGSANESGISRDEPDGSANATFAVQENRNASKTIVTPEGGRISSSLSEIAMSSDNLQSENRAAAIPHDEHSAAKLDPQVKAAGAGIPYAAGKQSVVPQASRSEASDGANQSKSFRRSQEASVRSISSVNSAESASAITLDGGSAVPSSKGANGKTAPHTASQSRSTNQKQSGSTAVPVQTHVPVGTSTEVSNESKPGTSGIRNASSGEAVHPVPPPRVTEPIAPPTSNPEQGPQEDRHNGEQPSGVAPPTFRNVEIGGGRITGYESVPGESDERQFAMYSTDQYMEPTGDYSVVKTVDGASWYKQYAEPVVKKTPRKTQNGKIAYDEKIVHRMPQIPKRKDRV